MENTGENKQEETKKLADFFPAVFVRHAIIARYLLAGGTAATADLLLLYGFTEYVGFHYLISAVLAFILAFLISFTLQKFWTFRDGSLDTLRKQAVLYLEVSVVNFFMNILLMYLFVEKVGLWYMAAQVVTSGLIAVISFIIYKYMIFKRI